MRIRSTTAPESDWRHSGACVDVDPDLFFPDPAASAADALAVCAGCDVRVECLSSALLSREAYGVWGGTTEQDRQRPLGQAAPTATTHGAVGSCQDGAAA